MNKCFAYILLTLLAACSGGSKTPEAKPYRFDRDKLDQLIQNNKNNNYDVYKRPNGTLEYEVFYIGDSVKYRLDYDEKSALAQVQLFDVHGFMVWYETYHKNGQRKSHYPMRHFDALGIKSVEHGIYEKYFEDGKVQEIGEYKMQVLMWSLEYDREGQAGDTTKYEYADGRGAEATKAAESQDSAKKPQETKPKVEKIRTATPTN